MAGGALGQRFPVPATAEERWWLRVQPIESGCWEWQGAKWHHGYGKFYLPGGQRIGAHRFGYELLAGPIPEGLQIDHLCRNPSCVNPAHLEPVTPRVNTRRGIAGAVNSARQRAVSHCPRGHEYNEANTYHRPDGGRNCRPCGAIVTRRRKAILREARCA